ncbi:class I adenylate-forming enzyme family protein [Streptomyces sp. NPDC059894]|uniref:class I adenylate-forming enzyme family protein n=1 Tax=unclassified Streptomyces TaxID=2593676 RepID=UPI003654790F
MAAQQEESLAAALTGPGGRFETAQEEVRGVRMTVFRNRLRCLRELVEASRRFGDRTFVIEDERRISFADHLEQVDACAVALQKEYGVRTGDRVGIFAANRWEWIVAFWAAAGIGAIPCGMNGWWTSEEFAHAARLIEPVLVLGDGPRLARLAGQGGQGRRSWPFPLVDLGTDVGSAVSRHRGAAPTVPQVAEDDVALILFTSGTTGRPKAVALSHRSVLGFAHVNMYAEAAGLAAHGAPVPGPDEEPPPSDAVTLITSPLFHVSMLQGVMLLAFARGGSVVLLPGRFDPERVLRAIEREKITHWSALGSAAPRTALSPALDRYDTSSIRVLGLGGAPVSPTVQQSFLSAFPSALTLGMGYSSTEGGSVIAAIDGADFAARPASTGRASKTVEIELRDPDGYRVPDGDYGEVHIRSPYLMTGYWNDPEATTAVLKDGGWLALGDVARMEDGFLYLNARTRDRILVNAENVSPTEVEYVLDSHPQVAEVAVIAVDDETTGDAVCAVVVVQNGAGVTEQELEAWCRKSLAHYKVPTRWHLVTDPLPRTPTGKVIKDRLRVRIAPLRS